MKTLKSFMLLVGILLGSTVFYSCLDDDDAYSEFWRDSVQAIVTVKPLSDNSYYMQLDDSTTLFPKFGRSLSIRTTRRRLKAMTSLFNC